MTDFLDALERQLIDAVERHAGEAVELSKRRRRSSRPHSARSRAGIAPPPSLPRPIALGVAASLLATVVALVVAGVLGSRSHGLRAARHPSPSAAVGLPARGHSRLASLSVADPGGGEPWGMRIVRTATNLVCLQVGRLERGRSLTLRELDRAAGDGVVRTLAPPAPPAGVIGNGLVETRAQQSGPRPLPPASERCRPAGSELVDYAAGVVPKAPGGRARSSQPRIVAYGLLGPDALSVSYRLRGRSTLQPVEPGTGAYLIVLPQAAIDARIEVTYRHAGRTCRMAVEPVSDGSMLTNPCPAR
jgi:hypothetical protein